MERFILFEENAIYLYSHPTQHSFHYFLGDFE
ncbi:hypothetical protein BB2000_0126 [Proteus mirabilis BB2000]|nr:hypothetical protein BB2000_0126 [Proteus mirabilis BB2000]